MMISSTLLIYHYLLLFRQHCLHYIWSNTYWNMLPYHCTLFLIIFFNCFQQIQCKGAAKCWVLFNEVFVEKSQRQKPLRQKYHAWSNRSDTEISSLLSEEKRTYWENAFRLLLLFRIVLLKHYRNVELLIVSLGLSIQLRMITPQTIWCYITVFKWGHVRMTSNEGRKEQVSKRE